MYDKFAVSRSYVEIKYITLSNINIYKILIIHPTYDTKKNL